LSSIDRKWQVMTLNKKLNTSPGRKVFYYYYFSHLEDYSHLLNFRISNNILHSRIFRFMEEYFVSLLPVKKSNDEIEITGFFVQDIAEKTFGAEGMSIDSVENLYKCLNQHENLKCLVVPVKICHSLDTDEKILNKICTLLMKFSLPENSDCLTEKKVVFLLNVEFVSNAALKQKSESIGNYLAGKLDASGLGELEMVSCDAILEWIRENIDSNPVNAGQYLQKYFSDTVKKAKRMAEIVAVARTFVSEKYINKT
jgi:hypothetical protein